MVFNTGWIFISSYWLIVIDKIGWGCCSGCCEKCCHFTAAAGRAQKWQLWKHFENIVSCPKVEPTTNLTEVSKQLDSCHNLVPASVRIWQLSVLTKHAQRTRGGSRTLGSVRTGLPRWWLSNQPVPHIFARRGSNRLFSPCNGFGPEEISTILWTSNQWWLVSVQYKRSGEKNAVCWYKL